MSILLTDNEQILQTYYYSLKARNSFKNIVIGLILNDNMVEHVCSIATLSDSPVHRGFIELKGFVIKLTFTIFKRWKSYHIRQCWSTWIISKPSLCLICFKLVTFNFKLPNVKMEYSPSWLFRENTWLYFRVCYGIVRCGRVNSARRVYI